MVTDAKEGKVFVDYKDEGVHTVTLKASGWNCSTNDIPRRQHRWGMLAKKNTPKQKEHINLCVYNSLSCAPIPQQEKTN